MPKRRSETGTLVTRRQWTRVGLGNLVLLLAVGLVGLSGAQAATVSKPGFTATVGATVAPTRLPRTGGAPVTLTLDGTTSRAETATPTILHAIGLHLDRQLTIDTEGLPACTASEVEHLLPARARRKCGQALIGSGSGAETLAFPEQAPREISYTALLFNTRISGRSEVLVYIYRSVPVPEFGVYPLGTGRRLVFHFPVVWGEGGAPYLLTQSFRYHLGRTWRYQGRKHSYLSARCSTGRLTNKVTLTFRDGATADASSPERCTKQ